VVGATAEQKDLLVALKFVPQESVHAASVALPSSVLDRAVDINVDDARTQDKANVIGSGTDDDDRPFPITTSVQVPQYVRDAVAQMTGAYSIKTAANADRKLSLRVTRFFVNESNKAVGSTYLAEVHLAYTLKDAQGTVLMESAVSGSASRYGRARSGDNCSEVLSDALKEAFSRVLGDQALIAAWSGTTAAKSGVSATPAAPATAPAKESIEQRLRQLDDLLKKGLITQEEYKVKRAQILKDA
jgi:Short C-terminal domain/Uncharacterized lipoprotein